MNPLRTQLPALHQFELELIPLITPLPTSSHPPKPCTALSCLWPSAFQLGQPIRLRIPGITREVAAETQVIDCTPSDHGYQLTLAFTDNEQAFRFRMVEQLCHIHHYHKQLQHQGRRLSLNDAAGEWIGHFADNFSSITAIRQSNHQLMPSGVPEGRLLFYNLPLQ
ncbi:MAG: hypothetical protein V7752_18440 [Halopseudomonas sp.]